MKKDKDKPPKVRRIQIDQHNDQKWLVLEGYIDGVPEVTKRRTVNVLALVSGDTTIEDEKAALEADVSEYLERWNAVKAAIEGL